MDSLLHTSIRCYRRMLSLLDGFREIELDQAESVILAHEEFASLQEELEEIDSRINARLAQGEVPAGMAHLLRERRELMDDVAEANRRLAPRLAAVMAVLQAELEEIRAGMTAVAGYGGGPGGRGQGAGFKAKG